MAKRTEVDHGKDGRMDRAKGRTKGQFLCLLQKHELEDGILTITAEVVVTAKTGAEMEALQAVSQAALTVYDMCKAVDRGMIIESIMLLEKSGGKSGLWKRR